MQQSRTEPLMGRAAVPVPTVLMAAGFVTNLPTTAPVGHVGVPAPVRVMTPVTGLIDTVIVTAAPVGDLHASVEQCERRNTRLRRVDSRQDQRAWLAAPTLSPSHER